MEQNIERRQLLSLGVVLFLAPALRLFPAEAASAAGRASWLTPLAALPLLVFYAAFLTKLLSLRREGEALPELLGRAAGKPALALTALWLLLYAAFVLRAGADRFVGTVYPRASYAVFAEVMGALALAGALAGMWYGANTIPSDWVAALAKADEIKALCESFSNACLGAGS